VDISETEPLKRAACYAHASQTPDRYYEMQDSVARFRGVESGYKRAEAFIRQIQGPYDIFQWRAYPLDNMEIESDVPGPAGREESNLAGVELSDV